jgi:hypothetical protein
MRVLNIPISICGICLTRILESEADGLTLILSMRWYYCCSSDLLIRPLELPKPMTTLPLLLINSNLYKSKTTLSSFFTHFAYVFTRFTLLRMNWIID